MNRLTIYYESPFWVGVFEDLSDAKLKTARVVFGTEPRLEEVYEFVSRHYYGLSYGEGVCFEQADNKDINPKRLQREVKRQQQNKGISSKAQEAVRLERESRKIERKKTSREEKLEHERQLFQKKQEKKKEKKKGH